MKDCIIVDIDGTIADLKHRQHHVSGNKNWKAFFEEMGDDTPTNVGEFVEKICQIMYGNEYGDRVDIFIFSGRPEEYRAITEKWLARNYANAYLHHEALLMRPTGDYRKDSIVKKEMLDRIRNQGYEPLLVIDDRPQVVDMWVKEGVTCLQHVNFLEDDKVDKIAAVKPGTLHMMIGPSGAGKTSYSNTTVKYFPHTFYVSSDDMHHKLCGDFKDQSRNNDVFNVIHELIETNIRLGFDVWYDATNIRNKDRRTIRDLVPDDCPIYYYVFDRPLEDKHKTAGWRDSVIIPKTGQKLIDYHHDIFQSNLKDVLAGDNDPRVTVYDRRF